MLDRAKKLLLTILGALETEIKQDIPIVVLEPSCATVFRDELLNLFPKDDRAHVLSGQTFLLSEFLEERQNISNCRNWRAKLSSTGIVTTNQ